MNEEEQPKSETPQLLEIAAIIMCGLLGSGNYTDMQLSNRPGGYGKSERGVYRPEVVEDAVELARKLAEALRVDEPAG